MTEPESKPKSCCTPARAANGVDDTSASHDMPDSLREVVHDAVVNIPGGQAFVGTDRPFLPQDGEGVVKRGRVKPFAMDKTCVTNERFAAFVNATGYITEAERLGDSFVFREFLAPSNRGHSAVVAAPWWMMVPGVSWRSPAGPGSEAFCLPENPVTQVTYNDALTFAAWAGGRLPTELEWEHAARGGQGDVPFPWGDQEPDDDQFFPCNIWQGQFPDINTGRDGFKGLAPAESYDPNPYGLFNMVGNVWEWTADIFRPRSISKAAKLAHADKKGFRVTKGGSFLCHASYCYRYRIAARSGTSPDSSMSHQGFRLVYDL